MNNKLREKILELRKMILLNELPNFIKTIKELIRYNNISKLTEPERRNLYNELLVVISVYQTNNSSYELKLHNANINFELKNYIIAEKLYKEVLIEKNDIEEVYLNLGSIYYNQRNLSEAIIVLNNATKMYPNNWLVYRRLGDVYVYKNNNDDAIIHYEKSIEINPKFSWTYYDLAKVYIKKENYEKAILYCNKVLEFTDEDEDFLHQQVNKLLNEIHKRKSNSHYEKVSLIIDEIKELLHTDNYIITHYTSLSTTRSLILNSSKLRLSEGTFLNDTSEGRTLLEYLDLESTKSNSRKLSYEFIKKPYIGSFVNHELDNDLTLWRMYGKEGKEEAEGCSLKIDGKKFISEIQKALSIDSNQLKDEIIKEFKFYRVAYLGKNFCKSGNSKNDKILKRKLSELKELSKKIELTTYILQRISEITYLFKTKEYQYENETRLVLSSSIFNEVLDKNFIPIKVYVELAPVNSSLIKLTIGPKVERADEWAASFYYSLKKENLSPKIEISTLPFK
jgi:tetratricopeptide (TPR) repeat protein